jgi:hypothetical protein
MCGETFASDKPFFRKSHLVTVPMESSIGFRISASATFPSALKGL